MENQQKKVVVLFVLLPCLLLLWVGGYLLASNTVSNQELAQDALSSGGAEVSSEVLEFNDSALETAIREELSYQLDEFTTDNVGSVEALTLRNKGITDLSGLEYFVSLQSLDLRDNDIASIGALSNLTELTSLNLRGNFIEDITPLTNLTELEELNVRENLIVDIGVLSQLTSLRDINIRYNQIRDISPLEELPYLYDRLYLTGNPIVDLRPIQDRYPFIVETDFQTVPHFSHSGGFYEEEFLLELSLPVNGATIYYTLDGSEPDPVANSEATFTYTDPIPITDRRYEENNLSTIRTAYNSIFTYWEAPSNTVFKGTVIRAKAVAEDGSSSATATHTFFIDDKSNEKYTFPVVSINTNVDSFFHEETGLFVNGNWDNQGRDWEREGNIEFFDTDGQLGFSQTIGVRVHGGWSREAPQKSLRLYARSDYGTNLLYHDLFNDINNISHKRLILRNSGNDFHRTMFRDAFLQSLVKHMNMDTQAFIPSIVFINGEYWGIHNIRERYDHWYLANQYDLDGDNVTIVENNGELDNGSEAGLEHYHSMISFVENNDLSIDENYEHLNTMVDIDNFIDYYIAQIYMANTDWPQNNVRLWRYNSDNLQGSHHNSCETCDGRWRWMLFDTDFGFGVQPGLGFSSGSDVDTNALERLVGDEWYQLLFTSLIRNEEFSETFILRFSDMLNTAFIPERVLQELGAFYELYKVEIEEHMERWNIPESFEIWEQEVDVMRQFATERPSYQWQHLQSHFQLGDTVTVQVNNPSPEGGSVQVNSVLIDENTPGVREGSHWEGVYFNEFPIKITAEANDGYKFVGWKKDEGIFEQNDELELVLEKDIKVTPIFEKQ